MSNSRVEAISKREWSGFSNEDLFRAAEIFCEKHDASKKPLPPRPPVKKKVPLRYTREMVEEYRSFLADQKMGWSREEWNWWYLTSPEKAPSTTRDFSVTVKL